MSPYRMAFAALSRGGADGRLSTLIFHRVLPQHDPLLPSEPDAAHFDAVCGWLRNWFNVLPLDEAVQRLRAGTLPRRAAAITFDDGYADNHEVALPILRRHRLPATFFIATGFLDGGRMWNDTLTEAVRGCAATVLDLSDLGLPGIGRVDLRDLPARRAAMGQLIGACKYLEPAQRAETVQRIAERTRAVLPDTLMMRSEQVRSLRRQGMQIGAHTVSHPILARLDRGAATAEITQSKVALESLLGERVGLFAYPNGKPGQDYGAESVELAAQAGFDAAVSTQPGCADARSDRWQLPRFTPWDRDRPRFGLRLAMNLLKAGSRENRRPVASARSVG